MSRHASEGGRRRIAPWLVITAVAVVVLAALTVVYLRIVNNDRNPAEADCSSRVVLPVTASPGAAAATESAAAAFDATGPTARSACVTTEVTEAPGGDVQRALASGWQAGPGPAPSMWAPDSQADLIALEATDSPLTAGRSPDPLGHLPGGAGGPPAGRGRTGHPELEVAAHCGRAGRDGNAGRR